MARKVADVMWEMLAKAGVKRCYGIVGDALNPGIDALRRNGKIEFIHVRHEEYGVFAAVAEAYLTGNPVADVVQILDGSVAAAAAKRPFLLYGCDGRAVDPRQIRVDDAGLRMR